MKTASQRFDSSWRTLLTGGFGSILLHLCVVFLLGMTLRGCQKASSGEPGGEKFRDIGLFVVPGVEGGTADDGQEVGAGDETETKTPQDKSSTADNSQDSTATDSGDIAERLPSEAPDLSHLLNRSESDSTGQGSTSSDFPSLIGPGDPIGGLQRPKASGGGSLIDPSEAGGAARVGGTGGPGDTTFMNVAGIGKSFVYVIDTSSSMHGSRLKIAQGQLKASLRLLQPNQKFAVVLYNEYRERLKLARRPEQDLYFATELNKQLASAQVDRITSDRGTEHKPALLEALSLKPDVIYFLTDGDQPELDAADLREIARVTGGTTIHVIKFGDGTVASRQTSWLERLARQSNGEFREVKAAN